VALFVLPEYDRAFVELLRETRNGLLAASFPVIGQIPRVKVRRLYHGQNSVGPDEPVVLEMKPIRTELGISQDTIHNTSLDGLIEDLYQFAQSYGKALIPQLFGNFSVLTDATGNVVDGAGSQFSSDLYLEILEKTEIVFDEHGEPHLPSVALSDGRLIELGEFTSEQEERKAQILAAKREAYLARRRHRRLPPNPLGT
jgi:hypothetical protein